ncbi:MAG: hypothetical protein ACLTXT_09570 [Ruminococcus callidus]
MNMIWKKLLTGTVSPALNSSRRERTFLTLFGVIGGDEQDNGDNDDGKAENAPDDPVHKVPSGIAVDKRQQEKQHCAGKEDDGLELGVAALLAVQLPVPLLSPSVQQKYRQPFSWLPVSLGAGLEVFWKMQIFCQCYVPF